MKPSHYTLIIGLEIHVELKTKSKMFCDCDAEHFQITPNSHTCPVCLGHPGALPVPNAEAIRMTQLIGTALDSQLALESKFDRKNYFYPDLPKGYQISQYDQPFCTGGYLTMDDGTRKHLIRAHLEEDTAKNIHKKIHGKDMTLVDFNRSSVPLLEIVTEPEFRDAEEVDEFLKKLRLLLRYLEVSDCDMEKGSMRLEVNMSLGTQDNFNPDDSIKVFPKYKVEVKNINSFRYVQKAIKYEFARQAELLDQGKTPVQETRGYQEDVDRTISQRTKEEAQDYRYFPDPDIPPLTFNQKDLDQLKSQLPQLPEQKLAQYIDKLKLAPETAKFLVANKSLAEYFETAVEEGSKHQITPQAIAKIIKNKKLDWTQNTPETLVKKLAQESAAKITDTRELTEIILNVLKANPGQVAEYKAGKQALLGFFMGQIMAKTKGQADAKITSTILNQELKK